MAEIITSQWGNTNSPQFRVGFSVSAQTGNQATVSWYCDYVGHGYAPSTNGQARAWSVTIDGQVRSGSYNCNGQSGTVRLGSGTVTVNKTQAARSIAVSGSFDFKITWAGTYSGARTCTGSLAISAITSHTVSYSANGGSGAPSAQTKWYGTVLKLSTTKPTRTGYSFQGWATSASGAVAYASGANYEADADATLYAVWKANTFTVSYNANGGSGAPGSQTKTYGTTLTLSSTKPTRANYNFLGWATSSTATTAQYAAGGSYTANAAVTLYAVWQLAYTAPRITNLRADRCNSGGTLTESGTYAKVTFSWATDKAVSAITVAVNSKTVTVSATGTSGSVSQVVGAGGLATGTRYTATVTVKDASGSSSATVAVAPKSYILDFSTQGGVGVGGTAPYERRALFHEAIGGQNFSGGNGSAVWVELGTWSGSWDAASLVLEVWTGNGYNGNTTQNTKVEVFVKNGYQSSQSAAAGAFGGTYTVEHSQDSRGSIQLKVMATAHNSCDVWLYLPWGYATGWYLAYASGGSWAHAGTTSSSAPTAGTEQRCALMRANLLDAYPVGAVYISYVSTSPASLFGGTWTAITGRFPYFNAGTATGGSNTHTLSVGEMPSHEHGLKMDSGAGTAMGITVSQRATGGSFGGYMFATGGGGAHNNMPAYQTLYAWRRTA